MNFMAVMPYWLAERYVCAIDLSVYIHVVATILFSKLYVVCVLSDMCPFAV